MFFLALASVFLAGEVGLFFGGALILLTIWLVHAIHSEYSPGGSGWKKGWPTLAIIVTFTVFMIWVTGTKGSGTPEGFSLSAFGTKYFSMGFWGWMGLLGEYLAIGLVYSLIEMRVALWRDKKNVVSHFEDYLARNVRNLLGDWLLSKLGSSSSGPETGKVIIEGGFSVVEVYAQQQEMKVKDKLLGWEHVLTDLKTWKDIFYRLTHPRQVIEGAEQAFKNDLAKVEAILPTYVNEAKHEFFNPHTAYLQVLLKTDGTLDVSIKKADLAICLANWTLWWWAYLLNLVLGDMIEMIYTKIASWVIKVYGSYVKKYFADIAAVKV